jgi:hypothetical protein
MFKPREAAAKVGTMLQSEKMRWQMALEGTVVNGVIVLDEEEKLPEGTRVEINVKEVPKAASPLGEMLLRHAGRAVGLPEDMAEQHDHYCTGRRSDEPSFRGYVLLSGASTIPIGRRP